MVELRPTVRALVLDADDRVLLQAYSDPTVHRPGQPPQRGPMWIAPGGGLAHGEDPGEGLAREVREETGLRDVAWGAWLWRRTVELHYQGRVRRFVEHYRLGRVASARPAVVPTALEPHEHAVLLGHRWWTLAALRATNDTVYPPRLAARLTGALAGPPPAAPLDISAEG